MAINVDVNGKIKSSSAFQNSRSVAVQEMLSHRPGFMIRWGITLFFGILVVLGLVCWFVQYPETVTGKARLTSLNAPKAVIAGTSGKLVQLSVKEGEGVKQGAVIGFIESTARHDEVLSLSRMLDSISRMMDKNQTHMLPSYFNLWTVSDSRLGELQLPCQNFVQAYVSFRNYLSGGFYPRKRAMLNRDMENLLKLNANLEARRDLQQQDIALAQKSFEASQQLNKEKYLSDFDYRNDESKLLSKRLSVPEINSAIISNESQRNEKLKEIMELENKIAEQRTVFLQALYTFKSQVDEWKRKYLLLAPVDGKISFTGFLQVNQQLKSDQLVCFVNPGNSEYYAEVFIPQSNFGKVKEQQEVLLKFPAYPPHEFGTVHGRLEFISRMQADSGYLAKVALPSGLVTDHKHQLQYHEGLVANAEIITENMRLLERFYYNITKGLRR